jgi:iron complex outermembrane recepter protein
MDYFPIIKFKLYNIIKMRKLLLTLFLFAFTGVFGQVQKNETVIGQIQSANGELLGGAHVSLHGTTNAYYSITDDKGSFLFKNILTGKYILHVSYTGLTEYSENITIGQSTPKLYIKMQQSTTELDEVTVTTQKRSQSPIDVPIAISAMSGNTLKNLGITEMDALSQYVPGLQVQIQSPNNASFVIRGVTSDDGDSRVQQRVSAFQDGISISKARGTAVELFDLERVEVAKGPQGTLFGRSAENGAIDLISNKPVNNTSGEIALGYGNYNEQTANGFFNTPVIKDKLFNRFAFSYDKRDGFIKNISGGTLNGKNTIALRNIIRYLPDAKTTVDVILNYQHDSPPGTSFKSGTYAPKGGDLDPNSAADLGGGSKDSLYIHRDVWSVTLPVTRVLSKYWTVTSLTGFRHFNTDEAFNADGTVARVLYFHEKEKDDQFSQEFRFNFTDKNKLSGFLGGSYFYENGYQQVPFQTNPQKFYTLLSSVIASKYATQLSQLSQTISYLEQLGYLSAAQTAYFLGQVPTSTPLVSNGVANVTTNLPNLSPLLPYIGSSLSTSMQQLLSIFDGSTLPTSYSETYTNYNTTSSVDLFTDATYKLMDNLSLTAGLRGTYEHQIGGYSSINSGSSTLGYLTGYYPNILSWSTGGKKYTASKKYFSYVGRLALNYIFDNKSVYVSVSRGRRPGVVDIGDAAADSTIYLKPEIIWSYEAGLKGILLDNSLTYDLSVFHYDWSHFQSNVLNTTTLKFVPQDAGKAHSFGVEAAVQYRFFKGNSFFVNYAYIDGKFNDKGENGETQEYAGNTFRLTPKHTFSTGINGLVPVTQSIYIYLRPSYTYKSKVYFEDENTEALSQSAYGLANLSGGVTFEISKIVYDFGFYSKNLFDTKYLIDAGNSGSLFGIPTYIGGTRRTYGLTLRARF